MLASPARSSTGLEFAVAGASPDDHDELYEAFARLIAAGEGFPGARPDHWRRL